MSTSAIRVSGLFLALILAGGLAGGTVLAQAAGDSGDIPAPPETQPGMAGGGMGGMGMMHRRGRHGGGPGQGKQCKMQGKRQGCAHRMGAGWKQTLTDEQKLKLDELHLAFARTKAPLKSAMKALKVELTVLATADEPDKQAINAKLDELLGLKRNLLSAKYAYMAGQRQVLTPEQRVAFDMDAIHNAMHGDSGGKGCKR